MEENYEKSVGWLIYKIRFLLKNKLQRLLADYDITTEQSRVLGFIYKNEGCNQKELALNSFKDRAVLTRILDILEKKELVKREKSPNDRREFRIYLTDKGKQVYNELVTILIKDNDEINSIFSEEELDQLLSLLNKLVTHLE